jgi:hypothetical protein
MEQVRYTEKCKACVGIGRVGLSREDSQSCENCGGSGQVALASGTKPRGRGVKAMLPIPISAAKAVAGKYGYDQVVILARRVGEAPMPHGEHVTSYGRNSEHCDVAGMMARKLIEVCQWPQHERAALDIEHWRTAIRRMRDEFHGGRETEEFWNHALKQFNKMFPEKK